MSHVSILFFCLLLVSSSSCNNSSSSEDVPPSKRIPATDQNKNQGAASTKQDKKSPVAPSTKTGNKSDGKAPSANTASANPPSPAPPASVVDKGTSTGVDKGPSPAPTGGGASVSNPPPSTQTPAGPGDVWTQRITDLQERLNAFASLVRNKAPASEKPVNDAQQIVKDALELAQTLASTKDEAEKSFLDALIQLDLATSRTALSRSYTAGLTSGQWPQDVDKAYRALVSKYDVLFP